MSRLPQSSALSTTPTSDNWSQVISGLKGQKYKLTRNEETHANSDANYLRGRNGSTPEGCGVTELERNLRAPSLPSQKRQLLGVARWLSWLSVLLLVVRSGSVCSREAT